MKRAFSINDITPNLPAVPVQNMSRINSFLSKLTHLLKSVNRLRNGFLSVIILLLMNSCDITEDPKFLTSDNLLASTEGAYTVLNGVYASVGSWDYITGNYPEIMMASSGLFNIRPVSRSLSIGSLSPYASYGGISGLWRGCYNTISNANSLIAGLSDVELDDIEEQNNILGQAYFIRSWTYFNLVRIWGDVPLIIEPATSQNVNFPRTSDDLVYEQIIADAKQAVNLLKDINSQEVGLPAKQAANMLLAKIYMTLAGNSKASETDYWQKAYDEAIQVYQKYSLVADYNSLWREQSSDNTVEGVFELQVNETSNSHWEQIYSAANSNLGKSMWGRLFINLEVYDRHVNTYPDDPRISSTFMTEYPRYAGSSTEQTIFTTYPTFTNRGNYSRSFPFLYKWFVKDPTTLNYYTNQNIVFYRYADMLLMLAEIENELNGPANAYKYVNEVLQRARNSVSPASVEPADWSGYDQDQFRENIMAEYNFELLGEGQGWFNLRRRGYEYFKTNVIEAHNSHPDYDFTKSYDNEFPDNDRIMLLPIPANEISANPNITAADQNLGY